MGNDVFCNHVRFLPEFHKKIKDSTKMSFSRTWLNVCDIFFISQLLVVDVEKFDWHPAGKNGGDDKVQDFSFLLRMHKCFNYLLLLPTFNLSKLTHALAKLLLILI